ncbi:general substrate transporter [Chytridium lagenaria]|nr:general substrate transporter [Chytridium lagenaria]
MALGSIAGVIAMPAWLRQFGSSNPDAADAVNNPYVIKQRLKLLVVSILAVGEVIGALLGSVVADRCGRKLGVIIASAVFSVGVAMQTDWVAGLGVGILSTLVPMYQSECAPKWIRGAVITCYQFAITVGILLASIVNNATQNRPNASAYQIPIGIQLLLAFILATGIIALPESPRWYVKCGKTDMGNQIFMPSERREKELGEMSYRDCFRNNDSKILRRTMTGIIIQACQQLTGEQPSLKVPASSNPSFSSLSSVSSTFYPQSPGMFAVERIGRRNLLLIGAAGMGICEFTVAIVGVTAGITTASTYVLIIFICIYIFFSPQREVFPLNIRAKAVSLSVASNWLWNFIIAFITPYMIDSGPGNANLGVKVFFIWGQRSHLEQIDDMYINCTVFESQKMNRQLLAGGGDEERTVKDDEPEDRFVVALH